MNKMEVTSNILIGLVAALHVGFLILEMFLFKTKFVQEGLLGELRRRFNQQGIGITARLAMNMGLYNGFLAAGLVWGLLATEAAFSIKLFFLVCVIIAGVFGGFTIKSSIFFTQALPAVLALVSLWLTQHSNLF
jgi:putative membrane protein